MRKPNPLSALDVPKEWPATAIKPNGDHITWRDAWATLSFDGLAMLRLDLPGEGVFAPYGNLAGMGDFEIPEETEGLLTREDLTSSGFADSTLEAWAKDTHGITLDLSGEDTTSLQAIRGEAYRRFLAEQAW